MSGAATPPNHGNAEVAGSVPGSIPGDPIAARLLALWQAGHRPDLRSFLGASDTLPVECLLSVIEIDQHERWRISDPVRCETYFHQFPVLAADPRSFSLILGEMHLQQVMGRSMDLGEWRQRFPAFADRFRLLESPSPDTRASAGEETSSPRPPPEGAKTLRLRPGSSAPPVESPPPPPSEAPPLTRVGPYEIQRVLAYGGMGVIYQAFDSQLKRSVALKMILAGAHADPEALARFRAEAEAVGRLQHPQIVQIYQVGEHDGLPYLALEYVDGHSLHQILGGKPMPARRSAETVRSLAQAIDFAHQRGIIHRDLKPGNILVDSTGTPKITDFGVAKLHEAKDTFTRPGEVLGTPNYMAPEQAEGTPEGIGPAADVYSLGAVLYELLTGQPPFAGGSPMETLLRVRLSNPVKPSHYEPRVPKDLETICLKCLRKDRHDRYASAAALADDLGRYLDGIPVLARPVSTVERILKWSRRHPASAALGATLAFLLIVSYALVFVQWMETEQARMTAQGRYEELRLFRGRLESQIHTADAATARAQRATYALRLSSADREWLDHDASRARQILDECPPQDRGWEWHYLRNRFEGTPMTLPAPGDVLKLTVLPGDRTFCAISRDGVVRTYTLATGKELQAKRLSLPPGAIPHGPSAFSPDGRWVGLAVGTRGPAPLISRAPFQVLIFDCETGALKNGWPSGNDEPIQLRFAPDGARLGWVSGTKKQKRAEVEWHGGELRVHDLEGTAPPLKLAAPGRSFESLAFDPKGTRVALTGHGRVLLIADSRTGAFATQVDRPHFPGRTVVWPSDGESIIVHRDDELHFLRLDGTEISHESRFHGGLQRLIASADGKRLATPSVSSTVRIWDTQIRLERLHLTGHLRWVVDAAFSKDVRWLVTFSLDQRIKVWDLEQGSAGSRILGRGDIAERQWIPTVTFSPDSSLLYSGSDGGKIRVYDVATGSLQQTLSGKEDVRSLAISPDGQTLAVAHDSVRGTVALWDLATGTEKVWPDAHSDDVTCVRFSPSGKLLLSTSEDGTAMIRSVATGNVQVRFQTPGKKIWHADWSAAAQVIATGDDDGAVRVWSPTGGALIRTIQAHQSPVACVTFNSHGDLLASANTNRDLENVQTQVQISDPLTGLTRGVLTGHENSIWSLAFSPDGSRLVSCGEDWSVKIWEPRSGNLVLSLKGHGDDVRCVTFSPNGKLLASSGDDPFIRVWDGTPLAEKP